MNRTSLRTLLVAAAILAVAAPAYAQTIPNPIKCDTVTDCLVNVLRAVLGLLGIIGVFMFIWGGFQFLLSGGNAESVKRGKATLFWSALGIIIILASYVIIEFIVRAASESTGT